MNINFSLKPVFENDNLVYICKVDKIFKSLHVVLLKLYVLKNNKNYRRR